MISIIIAFFIIYTLVKLSGRASGYSNRTNNPSNRFSQRYGPRGFRGGMYGPFFGLGGARSFFNRFYNDPNDPNNLNNPNNPYGNQFRPGGPTNNVPPTNSYNAYSNPNTYYTPPVVEPVQPQSSFNWPQPTENTQINSNVQPSAANSIHGWEMPSNQVVLKEVFVWVRSLAGWSYAGKLIVDGGLNQDEVKRYAQGKFVTAANDLLCIEAPSYEDARRTFEGYHLI